MIMWTMWRFPFWPLGPQTFGVLKGLVIVAGFVFSLVMLIDCLTRPASKFYRPLTDQGRYDRLIWAAAIFLSLWMYFLGAIVYFFVVEKAGPSKDDQAEAAKPQAKKPKRKSAKKKEP